MAVPSVERIEVNKISANCYTKAQFRKYVLDPLLLFAGKDDNGNPQKCKLGKTDGNSYDKILFCVDKEIKKFPSRGIISAGNVRAVIKILESFDEKNCKHKKEYLDVLICALLALEGNVGHTISYTKMSKKQWEKTCTRDIVCYMKAMVDNDEIPKFKKALMLAASVLAKKPKEEIKRESASEFIEKYYKP